jgi:hypothetical protein
MSRKQPIAFFAVLLILLTANGHPAQTAVKGYELFSWKVKNHWYYSLLPGTNRPRTYEEITAPGVVRRDAAGLKAELEKLSKGEVVVWMADAPAGASKSAAGQVLNVKHPSRTRIKKIKAICHKLGIRLRLS